MRLKLSSIPIEIRRRVAHHLESIRGTDMGRGADISYLGNDVCPIYRPDIKGPAYYEFEVLQSEEVVAVTNPGVRGDILSADIFRPGGISRLYTSPTADVKKLLIGHTGVKNAKLGQGFIIASAGDHDYPIVHWSLEQPPVSIELESIAAKNGKKVARVFKLDSLSYVAEDQTGATVSNIGQMPNVARGLSENILKFEGKIFSTTARPKGSLSNDESAKNIEHVVEGEKGAVPDLKMVASGTWEQTKKKYQEAYTPFLSALKKNAARTWEIDGLISKMGEGIHAGSVHRVALLDPKFSFKLTGEAIEYVKVNVLKRPGGLSAIELRCEKTPFRREASFSLLINYGDKQEEQLNFFIVDREVQSKYKTKIVEEV